MKSASLFPGQGSQHPGMGKELYDNFKISKDTFDEASEALKLNLAKLCFDTPESELRLTFNTQPALLITSISAYRVFCSESDHRPFLALGHSLGEYSALVAANALSLSDAIQAVRIRGLAMQEAVPVGAGSMMAIIGVEDEQVIKACVDFQKRAASELGLKNCVIEAANFNCPGQVVVSGHEKALQFMKDNFKGADYGASRAKIIPLAVSAPFHSTLMKPAQEKLKPKLDEITWQREMAFGVVHNVNAEVNYNGENVKNFLIPQVTKPVLWTKSIENTAKMGVNLYIEFGAGKVLSGLCKKILPESKILNVDGVEALKNTLKEIGNK
ncbi:MAG: ACP S-malonyltransferase [Oligoflexia bacterium]|nr:ACP S-malonyltransferase [Oligoflexia bacterium]